MKFSKSQQVAKKKRINLFPKMTEMQLVHWIISYIQMKGHTAWRNNAGKIPLERNGVKRFINIGQKGLPDVLGYTKDGRFIGIEAKIKPNKPSPIQQQTIDEMKAAGCIAEIVYSTDEMEKIL